MNSCTDKVENCEDSVSSIVIKKDNLPEEWYLKAEKYWSEIPATVDGVLGGFGFISQIDIHGSKRFLEKILKMKNGPETQHALDCGAGIGRITKCLLSHVFEKVDLVEQNPQFLEEFKKSIGPEISLKVENIFCCGLQNFTPKEEFYDVIWIQWVLGHLTDVHFIKFLKDCSKGLKNNGVIIIKENITSSGEVEIDHEESSVTRPLSVLKDLFSKAGLKCIVSSKQEKFPKGLYSVYMFALNCIY